ncbi:MAG: TonB-dependent receptor [Phenylobacterium sp.]|jgi:iron complex outermembrane receptor protein|uniref:TonB-dependent receptor n=1 Tax=Phenylobacterium sp. TaxID=1871053 RepID=UPI002A3668CF|nr:TonB-dependent receptor [Phenylobacterium sp.]MDX9999177.1 TonB-dependent receptor [Phenylobacterium sp.]
MQRRHSSARRALRLGAGLFISCAAGALLTAPAFAQSGGAELEEIVVTAQKRAENVQDVPLSVTAMSGERIEAAGAASMVDLASTVPSVMMDSSNNLRNTNVAIRGIGSSGTNPGIEPSVGVFVDGVYLPLGGMAQGELLDIETVEVLRGPQGTLYGRNTPVGAINITTRAPSREREGKIRFGFGDYDLRHVSGYVGGGLTDTLAGRLSFWTRDRSGYEYNLFTQRDQNDSETWGARARLLWEPSEDLQVNFIAHYSLIEAECCVAEQRDVFGPYGIATPGFLAAQQALGLPFRNFDDKDRVVDADDTGDDSSENYGASLQIDWQLASGHTVTSISALEIWDNRAVVSADALPQRVYRNGQDTLIRSLSEELRITSPTGGFVEYLGGVFLFAQDMKFDQASTFYEGANRTFPATFCATPPCRIIPGDTAGSYFTQDTRSFAVFGTATLNLTDRWSVTGGLRYSHDTKDAYIDHYALPGASAVLLRTQGPNHIGEVSRDESKVTWSANTRFRWTDDIMTFATVATGFKAGGFNTRRVDAGTPYEFEPEESITYEAGIKTTLLDRRLMLNATVFNMLLKDFQESVLNPVTGTGFIVGNAGERRVRGIEVDFRARPIPQFDLDGGVAYMDAEFTDHPSGQCPVERTPDGALPGTCNFTGLTPEKSPRWKVNLAGQWTQPLTDGIEAFGRAEMTYTSEYALHPTLTVGALQDEVTLVNLRAGIQDRDGGWQVAAWVRNATDESYYSQSTIQPLNAYVSGGGTAAARGFIGWYAPPRTMGVEVTLTF